MLRKSAGKSPKKIAQHSDKDAPACDSYSVHRINIRNFSYPVILLFIIIRKLTYLLLIAVVSAYKFAVFMWPRRQKSDSLGATETDLSSCADLSEEKQDMAGNVNHSRSDPMLAKQKHYHRKAFEYISKALKIDEETEGKINDFFIIHTLLFIHACS